MIKTFKKAISIFVASIFILSLLPGSALAFTYSVHKDNLSMPYTGDDTPYAMMMKSDGVTTVARYSGRTVDSSAEPVLEGVEGLYGKQSTDEVYKSYDLDSRSVINTNNDNGSFYFAGTNTNRPDHIIEFSFAYSKEGTHPSSLEHAKGTLIQSYFDYYSAHDLSSSSRTLTTNALAIRTDGIRFKTSPHTDLSGIANDCVKYDFKPNTWYTITLVSDLENKTEASTADKGSYTYKAYINGELKSSFETQTPYYGVRAIRLYPAYDAVMYWDNLNYYTLADASTFEPQNKAATLSSENDNVEVNGNKINLSNVNSTVADVKNALNSSLKANEVIRVYNSDLTQELESDSSALGTKLVVAGSKVFNGETTNRESVYTYYDIGIDGYAFDEPSITIDATKGVGKVKLYNYSGEEQQFKVYLAVYNGDELVGLNVSSTDLVAGKDQTYVEFTTPEADLTDANKIKLFVLNGDGITPELKCVEKSYTIADEYNSKNADLKSITLPMGEYNPNHNGISTLYPAFDKDITEYTIVTYMKEYAGLSPVFETSNSGARVRLTTEPDTTQPNSTAVYTVTSADGTVTKDYKFNYVASNNSAKRLYISNIVNVYTGTGRECLATWNGKTFNTQTASQANAYIQNGYFHKASDDIRTIKPSSSILEIDISQGPATIAGGFLRLALTANFSGANTSGTLHVHKINSSIYELSDIFTEITTSNVDGYFADKLCSVNVEKKSGNNADMYFVNIGADYYNTLKAEGKAKMYIGLSGVVNDPTKGFTAVFGGSGDQSSSNYTISCFDYLSE